ncbi:Conserved_hypothetical protein [Hexamita inflata]|uniref:EF-hand domain-containing protein n=1 Tax=Hexamita inflata TaxID=28002 RepID=A0AA86QXW7_9EUKA|nr:Conserved hypothetical protein [Hexamita inflata]CAI9961594.1 Conserved hypothetical protein [Hexamita inflata]
MGASNSANLDINALERAFKLFDENGNKTICSTEFANTMKELNGYVNPQLTDLCFQLVDLNGSATIDKKEFISFMSKIQSIKSPDIYDLIGCAADVNGDHKINATEIYRVYQCLGRTDIPQPMTVQEFVVKLRKGRIGGKL